MWNIGDLGGGNLRGKNDRKFISENNLIIMYYN